MKETIETGVRMVGHLLEHNGIVGPFVADKYGREVAYNDSQAFGWCMAGAIDQVSASLGFTSGVGERYDRYAHELTAAVMNHIGATVSRFSRVYVWESKQLPARIELARHLQKCGLE